MFDNILYRLAIKTAKVLKNYIYKIDLKRHTITLGQKDKEWSDLFNGQNSFVYKLNNSVKINLYRDSVLSQPIYRGFEVEEVSYLESVLKEGDIFIDIGANVGLFSLFASPKVGDTGRVISFEPTPITYNRLIENISLNDFKNIEARQLALSDKAGDMDFFISNNGYDAWNSLASSSDNKLQESIKVPVSTLDKELERIDKSNIRLVKIDVEGWEKFTLLGGLTFLENFSPILMVEFTEQNTFNAGYMVQDVYKMIEELGYKWFTLENGGLVQDVMRLRYPYVNLIAKK